MQYFLIIVLTSLFVWTIISISDKRGIRSVGKIVYSQSSIYEVIKNFIPKEMFDKPTMITQSMKSSQKNMIKVIVDDNKAYWVTDNVFYVADTVNGRIDQSTVKPLNTDNLSKHELDKLLSILDALTKGKKQDDSGSTGN